MADYYENAYVTISASSSPNEMISFLRERESKRSLRAPAGWNVGCAS